MKSTSISPSFLLDNQTNRTGNSATKEAEDFRSMLDPARFETSTPTATSVSRPATFAEPYPAVAKSSTLVQKAKGFTTYHNKRFYPLKERSEFFHPMPLNQSQREFPVSNSYPNQLNSTQPRNQQTNSTSVAKSSPPLLAKIKNWFSEFFFGDAAKNSPSLLARIKSWFSESSCEELSQLQQVSDQQQPGSPGILSSVLGLLKHFGHLFTNEGENSKVGDTLYAQSSPSAPTSVTKPSAGDNHVRQAPEISAGLSRQSLPSAPVPAIRTTRHATDPLHNQGIPDRIHHVIMKASTRYGLPPKLIAAVVKVESGFNPHAVSPAGAKGLMQLMPATAHQLRVKNCFDIEQNIDGGCRYLKQLLNQFDGRLPLALAAYNAGSGAVKEYGGVPPYHETRRYVRKVLAYL